MLNKNILDLSFFFSPSLEKKKENLKFNQQVDRMNVKAL